MIPPRIITIKSDGNVLTYQDVLSGKEIKMIEKTIKKKKREEA